MHDKALVCDDNALDVHTTKSRGVHNKDMCTTEEFCRDRGASTTKAFCHDRDFSIARDLSSSQKKTPGFGVSQESQVTLG